MSCFLLCLLSFAAPDYPGIEPPARSEITLVMGGFPTGAVPDTRGAGPVTELEHACIANTTRDCIVNVTAELQRRGLVATSTWVDVMAILRGINEAERALRALGLEEIEFRRRAAEAAIAAGDVTRALEHMAIGWSEPKSDHVDDIQRFLIIRSAVEQTLLVANDGRSYRRALRAVFSNYPVDNETGRVLAMPELHRILLMSVFATSPKAPATGVSGLWPGNGWEDNSRSHQAHALYVLSDIDPASETEAMEAKFTEVNPAFHDFLRGRLSHRLFLAGETQKAIHFAQQIGDPDRRNYIIIEGLRILGPGLSSEIIEASLDELGVWASRADADPFFVLEYALLQERFEKSGRLQEVDVAIRHCIEGNGWSNSARPVEMLAENGRWGDAITLTLYYPRPSRAVTSLAEAMMMPRNP